MALGDVHTPPMTRRGARYRYPGSRGTCVHMMHAGCMACSLPSGPAAVARRCAWLPAATSDNPTRGEDTELAARPRMARRNGPIGARGVDARHSTYHRNRCRRRSRCIVNPRARMKKPHTPHAPASRETPREGEPRPRWSMRAAGPARVGASAGRPRAPDCPCARGVGSRFEFINYLLFYLVSRY